MSHHWHHGMGMSDPTGIGMLPYDPLGFYEPPKPRLVIKLPRVVPEQKSKFESDDLFRRLSRESEVRYTGYRDRPLEERQMRFQNGVREGHTEIAFIATGTNLQLVFNPNSHLGYSNEKECDFERERGKVHVRSHFIMNGVCVRWKGWLDLDRLDGIGCLEYDDERAQLEDLILKDQMERYNHILKDIEERQKIYKNQQDRSQANDTEARKKNDISGARHNHN